jgi:hypothetical protein
MLSVAAETIQVVSKMFGQVPRAPHTKTNKKCPPTVFGHAAQQCVDLNLFIFLVAGTYNTVVDLSAI